MTPDTDNNLRRFEVEVLDFFHTSLPLWTIERCRAVYGLIAAFDTTILPMETILSQTTSEDIGTMLRMKFWYEGFNQALRWLTEDELIMPSPVADGELLEKGGEFLLYAATRYVPVASMHVAYSRGLAAAEVDEQTRSVRFLSLPSPAYSAPWFNFAEMAVGGPKDLKEEQKKSIALDDAIEVLANMTIGIEEGTIRFNVHALLTPEILRLADIFRNTETIPLDMQTDLVGFSLSQFRGFWRVLFAWSMGASLIFRGLVHGGTPQENCIPTQMVPREEFLATIAKFSGLPPLVVLEIVKRLSYTPGRKADIFLQPLLCSADWVTWSPLAVQ